MTDYRFGQFDDVVSAILILSCGQTDTDEHQVVNIVCCRHVVNVSKFPN